MRNMLLTLLLASAAATPALAGPVEDRAAARAEREQQREDRQQQREDRRASQPAALPTAQVDNSQGRRADPAQPSPALDLVRDNRAQQRNVRQDARQEANQALRSGRLDRVQQRAQDNRQLRDERRDLRQSTRQMPPVMNRRPPVVSSTPRPGTQPPPPAYARPANAGSWNTSSWRQNNRYDWQDRRRNHRSLFHLGFYYDPFGWGYSPYQVGWRMWPSYYNSSFWLDDPWMYRLPYAPPGYRWIRYYDDAILIDTWSGQVADVIYDFFW